MAGIELIKVYTAAILLRRVNPPMQTMMALILLSDSPATFTPSVSVVLVSPLVQISSTLVEVSSDLSPYVYKKF